MNALHYLEGLGLTIEAVKTDVCLKGLSHIKKEDALKAIEFAKKHKNKILVALYGKVSCEICPAGGYWDWKGPGLWCFYSAYFLGKPAKPIQCKIAKKECLFLKKINAGSKA